MRTIPSAFARALVLCLIAFVATSNAVEAQTIPGFAAPTGSPLPPGVRSEGLYRSAPVMLDGATLFRVASQANAPQGSLSAELRVQFIGQELDDLLAMKSDPSLGTAFDPKTLHLEVAPDGPQAMIMASDATHTTPVPVMTVTVVDGKYQKLPVEELAAKWRDVLQTALVAALERRQPASVRRNVVDVWRVLGGLVALTLVLWLLVRWMGKSADRLRDQIVANERAIGEVPSSEGKRGLAEAAVGPEMRLRVLRGVAGLFVWLGVLAWLAAILWGLSLFPQTATAAHALTRGLARVAFIWIAAALLLRIADIAISRLAAAARGHLRWTNEEDRTRQTLRLPTIARALDTIVATAILFSAGLATLSAIGLPIASVLTIGGVIAFAVSFAAQNLVRDYLNGFLVLAEDQYVVGDWVTINEWSGIVESMTLRIVKVRDAAGNLVTIPYGSTAAVVNGSRNWSRVDYRIAVSTSADLGKAIVVLRETVEKLAADPAWRGSAIDPEWTGVESVSATGILLRSSMKTAPLRQFDVRREINQRVVEAFSAAGIPFGVDAGTTTIIQPPRL